MMRPQARSAPQQQHRTELDTAIATCWSAFGTVAVFSLIINLLMLAQPLYMLQVYDRVLTTGRFETLIMLTLLAAGALLILGMLDALRSAVTIRVGIWLNERLGPVYVAAGVRTRLQGDASGAQPLRDLAQIQSFIGTQGLNLFFDSPWVPLFLFLIWMLHPLLGTFALASAVVLLALALANELLTRKSNRAASVANISAMQEAEATIRNAEVVQAMGMLPAMVERWRNINQTALDATRSASEWSGILVGTTRFLRLLVQVGILGLGATLVMEGQATPGTMIAASILLSRALAPVELAMTAWRNFSNARLAYGRLRARLNAAPDMAERTRLPDPAGRIKVENLSYAVPGTRRAILQQVSFAIEPGEAVAVVGPSAAGKSTLARLLVGTLPPSGGQIRIDGSELAHWDPAELGRFVGYLPQDVELFAGTVRDNIARMGKADDEAVVAAAQLAHAHEMIQQLADGYDTQIGDGGARLSGGQRQRIGLARAVYGDPRLIVLDEPNSNLDQNGETALAAAVAELKRRGAALVIVGHRPSTLAQADKILLLKDGRVRAFGPRDSVLQELRTASAAGGGPAAVPIQRAAPAAASKPAAIQPPADDAAEQEAVT